MQKAPMVNLGKTGLRVSKLGFGEADFGTEDPYHLAPKDGWRALTEAFKLGVNLWDTSDDYSTHPNATSALRHLPRKDLAIVFKTNAHDGEEAARSLTRFLKELGTEYVDVLMLHCVQSNWRGYSRALKDLNDIKAKGKARAIGLSTHSVRVVREASQLAEVDVILTICCKADAAVIDEYVPIEDGTIEEMYDAVRVAHENGKGTIAMKILGGRVRGPAPELIMNYRSSISVIAKLNFVDAMFIGMSTLGEIEKNIKAILSANSARYLGQYLIFCDHAL